MLRAAACALSLALLVACGSEPADVARDADGRPTEAGTVRADRIRVGDCFEDPEDDGDVAGFAVVPCGEPHDNEVFHLYEVDGEAYPGRDALESRSTERCEGRPFEDYVGAPVGAAGYEVFQIVPSPETWAADGDRTVVCVLYDASGSALRGSARGSSA